MNGGHRNGLGGSTPHLRCEFEAGGQRCSRPATTAMEWEHDGWRDGALYCDKHAAELLRDPSTNLSIDACAELLYWALTDPTGSMAQVLEDGFGVSVDDGLLAEFLEFERHRFGVEADDDSVLDSAKAAADADKKAAESLVRAAEAALRYDAAALQAGAGPDGDTHAADQANEHADVLARLDTSRPLTQEELEALHAGHRSLRMEAAEWRGMARELADDTLRSAVEDHAALFDQVAEGVRTLGDQLAGRDPEGEREAER